MTRTKSLFSNVFWGITSFGINSLFGLYLRKLFLNTFEPDLLGYQGTIAGFFSLLNVVEMGSGTVITYHLYKALADKDDREVSTVISVYRYTYRMIGMMLLFLGVCGAFFLQYIFVEENINWDEVYVIYAIYLLELVLNYHLVFRRALFNADQKAWVCSKIDLACSCVSTVARALIIYIYPDYRLYMAVWILSSVISNVVLIPVFRKFYPWVTREKVTWRYYKKIRFFHDVKWYVIQHTAFVLYSSIDSILIAHCIGVSTAMLVSNYNNISMSITALLNRATMGLQSGLGNISYADNLERKMYLFKMMDRIAFALGSIVACCYMYLFQPVIELWLGTDFLLPYEYVVFFSLNQYLTYNQIVVTSFRTSIGKYELDTSYMIFSALVNTISSCVLMNYIGITGLMIGTCLANLIIWAGRTRVLFGEILTEKEKNYYWREQVCRLLVFLFTIFVVGAEIEHLGVGVWWMPAKVVVCCIFPILFVAFFYRKDGVVTFVREKLAILCKA